MRARNARNSPPAEAAPAAPSPPVQAIAIVSGAKLLWIDEGLHSLSIAAMEGAPHSAGAMALPAALITAPGGEAGPPVEIISAPGAGAWIGADGGTVALRSPPAGGHVLVTAYAMPGQALAPLEIDLHPIDGNSAVAAGAAAPRTRRSLRADVILHIQSLGDRRFSSGGWAGTIGSRLRIEAIGIHPQELIGPQEIEYKVLTRAGRETPWVNGGVLCGSRGQGLPLTGFAVRLAPHVRDAFDVVYRGAFFASGPGPVVRNGETCLAPLTDDPLEAVEIRIMER